MMELRSNTTTPYGRKVMICARLLQMHDDIRVVTTIPYSDNNLRSHNPLGRVPVLHDGDEVICDSFVIMQYLQQKSTQDILYNTDDLLTLYKNYMLAEGMLTAGINYKQNLMRHAKDSTCPIDDWYMQRQLDSIDSGLMMLNSTISSLPTILRLDTISAICMLDWLDFRLPDVSWQAAYPHVAAWQQTMHKQQVVADTMPCDY